MKNRFQKLYHSRRGISIMETLTVLVIFSLLMGGFITVMMTGVESWRANGIVNDEQTELRKALAWITGDLMQTGSSVVSVGADGVWNTSISFKKAVGVTNGSIDWSANTIRYALSGTNPILLMRTSGADPSRIVALNIDTLKFRRLSTAPNVIEVELRACTNNVFAKWSNIKTTLKFSIKMRD